MRLSIMQTSIMRLRGTSVTTTSPTTLLSSDLHKRDGTISGHRPGSRRDHHGRQGFPCKAVWSEPATIRMNYTEALGPSRVQARTEPSIRGPDIPRTHADLHLIGTTLIAYFQPRGRDPPYSTHGLLDRRLLIREGLRRGHQRRGGSRLPTTRCQRTRHTTTGTT